MKRPTTNDRIKQDKPIEVWVNERAGWTWKVWKFYKRGSIAEQRAKTIQDQYGRVFCSVSSPHTFGGYDMGDVYYKDIRQNAVLQLQEEVGEKLDQDHTEDCSGCALCERSD